VALCSRVRLARNLRGYRFTHLCADDAKRQIHDRILRAAVLVPELRQGLEIEVGGLDAPARAVLRERQLVRVPTAAGRAPAAPVLVGNDQASSLTLHEEDHLRLQVLLPGLQLHEAWRRVDRYDTMLAGELDFAFTRDLGFLTVRPGNVGTGLRASVLLHVPGLVLTRQVQCILKATGHLRFSVRGFTGDGDELVGSLLLVANHGTLGESEEDILGRVESFVNEVTHLERQARQLLLETQPQVVFDFVGRAYGAMRHAFRVGATEALEQLSALRLGADLQMLVRLDRRGLAELTVRAQPGHLQRLAGRPLTEAEQEVERARLLRDWLGRATGRGG
jgi:protein arginine kinase